MKMVDEGAVTKKMSLVAQIIQAHKELSNLDPSEDILKFMEVLPGDKPKMNYDHFDEMMEMYLRGRKFLDPELINKAYLEDLRSRISEYYKNQEYNHEDFT